MGAFRFPGPMCLTLNAVPRPAGTRARAGTSAAGPVGAGGSQSLLTDIDHRYLRDLKPGRFSLDTLRGFRATHVRELASAIAEYGSHSWGAEFQQAILARLDHLIAEAQPARGATATKLRKLLKGKINPLEVKKLLQKLLAEERQRQLSGHADDDGHETTALVTECLQAVSKVYREELAEKIEKAKRPGNNISDADLSRSAADVLGAERSKQLFGVADDDPGEKAALVIVTEALEVSHTRHLDVLKALDEQEKRTGKKVSDAQFKKAIQDVLGTERQRQLLGAPDDAPGKETTMVLVTKAVEVTYKHHMDSLKHVIATSKHPGQTVTPAELRNAVVQAATSERQRELLGSADAGDNEFSEQLAAAAKVKTRKRTVPAKPGAAKGTVQIGPATFLRRR